MKSSPAHRVNEQSRREQACRERGLPLTAPRRAILHALLQQQAMIDAIALQQIAREQHAPTSLGTVHRFLRELHAWPLVQAHVPAHGRTRWRLQPPSAPMPSACPEVETMWLQPLRTFMHELESIGLAEVHRAESTPAPQQRPPDCPPTLHQMLQAIAFHLGYRLS